MITIDIDKLISFMDEEKEAKAHSNSVKSLLGEEFAFALLIRYFQKNKLDAELLNAPCTTSGNWLDGWVLTKQNNNDVLYQVEVKLWSYHSYKGSCLPLSCTQDQLMKYKQDEWNRYWDQSSSNFKMKQLAKVLIKMDIPPSYNNTTRLPLACIWPAVHPTGEKDCFFRVQTKNPDFPSVFIFSMSSYLRCLREKNPPTSTLDLDLPKLTKRINYITDILSVRNIIQS